MTPEPWDDERLAAAFADRFDRPAPRELLMTTLDEVRSTPRRPRWWLVLDWPTGSRLAVVVAAVAVVSLVGVAVLPRTSSEPAGSATASAAISAPPSTAPTPAQNTPYQSFEPSPAVEGFAAVAAGLSVRSVADAPTFLTDTALGDTELAFGGWYSASQLALPCPYQFEPASPIEIRCGDVRAGLAATPQPIFTDDGSPILGLQRPVDVISPRFVPPVDPILDTSRPRVGPAIVTTPRPLILVGHFHDERAVRCPADVRSSCEQTFVVDGVASASGELVDPAASSAASGLSSRLTAAQVAKLAQDRIDGYGQILSVGLMQGSDAPWFTSSNNLDCLCPPTWFVRGYRTLIDDGTDPRASGTPIAGWLTIDDATGAIAGPLTAGIPAPASPFPYASAPAGFPTTVEGLPVRTVADITAHGRPPAEPGSPIAVAGWFTELPLSPCSSASPDCNRDRIVLASSDQRLFDPNRTGPMLEPSAAVLYPAILPGGAAPPAGYPDGVPRRAVFVVHEGDLRADTNGPGNPVGPGDLVLDQVAWLDGVDQPASVWIEPGITPTRSLENVLLIAGPVQTNRTWTTSISAVSAAHLRDLGSTLTTEAKGIVWLIRLVGANPLDPTSGPGGWGAILVDDATGEFHSEWSSASP